MSMAGRGISSSTKEKHSEKIMPTLGKPMVGPVKILWVFNFY